MIQWRWLQETQLTQQDASIDTTSCVMLCNGALVCTNVVILFRLVREGCNNQGLLAVSPMICTTKMRNTSYNCHS